MILDWVLLFYKGLIKIDDKILEEMFQNKETGLSTEIIKALSEENVSLRKLEEITSLLYN